MNNPPALLNDSAIDEFAVNRCLVIPEFLSTQQCARIRGEIDVMRGAGTMHQAAIGKQASQEVNLAQRGDFIRWIEPTEASESVRAYLELLENLRIEMNRSFYLGLQSGEFHLTEYPPGSYYKRHVDRHRSQSSRILSLVLYLNEGWAETDGGQLVVYLDDESERTIFPQEGTLVLFMSEMEHEVLLTKCARKSITGWFRNQEFAV